MDNGYIKLWRKIEKWDWYDDDVVFAAFIKMLIMANWQDKKWHGITVKRGSFVSSRTRLSAKLGLSAQCLRTVIDRLKSTGEMSTQSTSHFTIYTLDKYRDYQSKEEELTNELTNELTSNQPAINQPPTTTKERKNIRKKEYKNKEKIREDSMSSKLDNVGSTPSLSHNGDITVTSQRYHRDTPQVDSIRSRKPIEEGQSVAGNQHDDVVEIFAYWQVTLSHPKSLLDKKRRGAIVARLQEGYSVERIKQAIDGIKTSTHHMGQNNHHTIYDDIELICRSGANVDRFAELTERQALPDVSRMLTALAGLNLKGDL